MPASRKRIATSTVDRFGAIVRRLLEWHQANRRSFLWRSLRGRPYVVLVSEMMLQQTGTKQVEQKLPPFLKRFPTVHALAKAPTSDVLRAWQGLGYNRRALNLHQAAKAISARGRRPFPASIEELMALPGIGRYTASALMAFLYDSNVPVLDVNVERVLSRLWKRMPDTAAKLPMREVEQLDIAILEYTSARGHSAMWHEGLMDLGATLCTKRAPKCEACPLLQECKSGPQFMRRSSASVTSRVAKREKQYFGAPRRIWRGRVLGIIANEKQVTEPQIVRLLEREFGIDDSTFAAFIEEVVALLVNEGFVSRRGKQLQLGGEA